MLVQCPRSCSSPHCSAMQAASQLITRKQQEYPEPTLQLWKTPGFALMSA